MGFNCNWLLFFILTGSGTIRGTEWTETVNMIDGHHGKISLLFSLCKLECVYFITDFT